MLLAGMSDYFRAMLLGPMKESQESHVDLKALTAESLQLIVNFLYSGVMHLVIYRVIVQKLKFSLLK